MRVALFLLLLVAGCKCATAKADTRRCVHHGRTGHNGTIICSEEPRYYEDVKQR